MPQILLVDDDADVVARNEAALKASGHTVVTARTTAEALAAIRANATDAVVLEAMLDGALAGFDLARTLAREYPLLPVIMLTRVDEYISDWDRAKQDRDDGWIPVQRFMEKPVDPAVVVYEVEHVLPHGVHAPADVLARV